MQSVPYVLMSSIPMFVCCFWGIFFFSQYGGSHTSRKVMAWFMLIAAFLYFGHFVVFNHLHALIPVTDTIYSFATLSVYPVFYLYIHALTSGLRKVHLAVLLPGLLIGGAIGCCYLSMPAEGLLAMTGHILYEKGPLPDMPAARLSLWLHRLMKYVILLEVVCVLSLGFHELAAFRRKVVQFFSNTRHKDLKEVRNLLYAFVLTSCCSVVADLVGRAYFVDSLFLLLVVLVPFSVLLFSIGYIGHIQHFTADDLRKEMGLVEAEIPEQKTSDTKEGRMDREALLDGIRRVMVENMLFLNPDFKLSDLARQLNSNRTYIYDALKQGGKSNFTDYVNRFRIEYSLELLKAGEKKIEEVAYESGFASKTVYYRNFKKQMGMTPGEYQKVHGKDSGQ